MGRKIVMIVVASVLAVSVTGCQSNTPREDSGRVIGGILGGVLGSQVGKGKGRTAAIIAGTLVGASIGGGIGRSMDDTDRLKAQRALETRPTHQPSTWRNPDSGNRYTVTPTNTYTKSSGEPCRDYTTDAVIDGRRETVYGTACRRSDGTWWSGN